MKKLNFFYIRKLTPSELEHVICDFFRLNVAPLSTNEINGRVLNTLQNWSVYFACSTNEGSAYRWKGAIFDGRANLAAKSIQELFLMAAQVLGRWSPPEPVKSKWNYWMGPHGKIMTVSEFAMFPKTPGWRKIIKFEFEKI